MEFVVLPDGPAAAAAAAAATERFGPRVVPHASGRPWIVGRWEDHEFSLSSRGPLRVVLLGHTRPGHGTAADGPDRLRSLAGLDRTAGALRGPFHLLASMAGTTRSQGTVSTTRQIFHARLAGVTVAANSPGALRALTGATLDPEVLSLRLLTPAAPWPLSQRPIWSGVRQLGFGCWLEVGPDGAARDVPWWSAPASDVPLRDAATGIRVALRDAVSVRVAGRSTVSADIGGIDSTGLCFLAAADPEVTLLTCHLRPLDRGNDDTEWVDRAYGHLPAARHRVLPMDDAPGANDPLADGVVVDEQEGPPPWARGRAYLRHTSRTVAEHGAAMHLTGLGGDELFGAIPVYLWSLVRRRRLASIRSVHRARLLNRWRLGPTVRALLDRTSHSAWLRSLADHLTGPPPASTAVSFGWGPEVRMPPWVTDDAVQTVRRLLRDADEPPLDDDRYRHQILVSVVFSGAAVRQLSAAHLRHGVEWQAPYLDDRVIEAAMSVRIEDRAPRGRYKPALVAALRGVVPDPLLERRSKGEYSAEAYEGLRRNRRTLLAQCDDLRLAELGLVDPAALRAALQHPGPEFRHLIPFDNTLACEAWLRFAVTGAAESTAGTDGRTS